MPMMIMEPLMFLFVIFLQLFVVRSQGQDLCMGCASDTSCHQFDSGNGKYVGCHGTFRDFATNTEAAALCADGWSLMSVAEAAAESFTKAMCDTTPDDTIFFFNEGAGFALCNSDTGKSDTVSLVGCLGGGTAFAAGAFSLASACQGITSDAIVGTVAGIINAGTFGQAYNTLDMLDATYGGVVCIREPTPAPSEIPTAVPTAPSSVPSFNPTTEPSNTAIPSSDPTGIPTAIPTTAPTDATMVPSANPSERPSSMPSFRPSITPTNEPTDNSVDDATPEPTIEPTEEASDSYDDDGHGNDWVEPCLRDPCVCRLDDNCKICNFGDHEGCSECIGTNGEYFKLDWNYPCRKCNDIFGDSCLFCQDFNGCAKCKKGYIRTYDENADLFYCDKKKKGKKKQRNFKKCGKQFGDGCLDCNKQLGCIECDEDNGYDMIMKNNGLTYCDSIDNNNNINNNVLDVNDKDVEDGSYSYSYSYSTVIMALIAGILSAYVVTIIYTRVKQFCIKTNTKLTQNTEYQPLL